MPIKIFITRDFEQMSQVGATLVKDHIIRTLSQKKEMVLGLATGHSPTGLYKHLARAANAGEFDSSRIRSFNLDEYVGLPGENAQQRVLHRESYCSFMIQEFFSLLNRKFIETSVPYGALIEQQQLIEELQAHPGDWREEGADAGRSIVIKAAPASNYLAWIRAEILEAYARKIQRAGGIDLQIIGVGGRGHTGLVGDPRAISRGLLDELRKKQSANLIRAGQIQGFPNPPGFLGSGIDVRGTKTGRSSARRLHPGGAGRLRGRRRARLVRGGSLGIRHFSHAATRCASGCGGVSRTGRQVSAE